MRLFVALSDPVALGELRGLPVRREWQAVWFDDNGDEVPGVMVDVDSWRQEAQALDVRMTEAGYVRVPMMAHVRRLTRGQVGVDSAWLAHAERYEPLP